MIGLGVTSYCSLKTRQKCSAIIYLTIRRLGMTAEHFHNLLIREDNQDLHNKKGTTAISCSPSKKDGGLLLSRIALQYHRRNRA